MKVAIINGSPRKHGNTMQMCESFAKGVLSKNQDADIQVVNLYEHSYKGCTSCFACKMKNGKSYGRCAHRDELTPIIELASNADILVLASPIYLMDITGEMKSFLERLCYPYGSYEEGYRSLAPKRMKTVTIYTMNCTKEYAPVCAIDNIDMFVGHIFSKPERLCAYNTYQFSDYSKYMVEVFKEEEKAQYKEELFPKELHEAYTLGSNLAE